MARTAWRPARGKNDRHGQSGLHLDKPLSQVAVEAIVPMDAHSGRDPGGGSLRTTTVLRPDGT